MFATRYTKGIKRLSSRALITIPDYVKEILVGILLNDTLIVKSSPLSNSILIYAQTAITHK